MNDKKLKSVGVIGRFKPVHNGHTALLETICQTAEQVIIGIGSSNCYDAKNPFTADETRAMLAAALPYNNYRIVTIPDNHSDAVWKQSMINAYRTIDVFVTGNDCVANALEDRYKLVHPNNLLPQVKQHNICASMVREAMLAGKEWKQYIPKAVADYLEQHHLVDRFVEQFGGNK